MQHSYYSATITTTLHTALHFLKLKPQIHQTLTPQSNSFPLPSPGNHHSFYFYEFDYA